MVFHSSFDGKLAIEKENLLEGAFMWSGQEYYCQGVIMKRGVFITCSSVSIRSPLTLMKSDVGQSSLSEGLGPPTTSQQAHAESQRRIECNSVRTVMILISM